MTEWWLPAFIPSAVIEMIRVARVGRLATVTSRNQPRVVPICFALLDYPESLVVSVLDEKPKRVGDAELARVRNLRMNPACSLVIDHYEEDWTRLAFAQINGTARILEPDDHLHGPALVALRSKYPQYRAMELAHRPVIAIKIVAVTTWRGARGSSSAEV